MIQSKDGLYLNGVLVGPSDGITTTYQGNDLSKPDTLQVSHSNTFQLADSLTVRELTRNAEQIDSGAGVVYQTFDAILIDGGEVILRGFAELGSFANGWNVTLYESKLTLFEQLERSLRTVDLSRFDHPWTVDGINSLALADAGACYPLIDYGLLSSGEMPLDSIFPATYVHTIVTQMLYEQGYTLAGSLLTDNLYKALTLPFVEEQPTARDEDFAEDRRARVAVDLPDYSFDTNNNKVDRIQPYTVDNQPLNVWLQGKLHNFDTSTYTYVCDTAMRMHIEVHQGIKLKVFGGEFEIILILYKNGQEVARDYKNYDTGHNLLGAQVDTADLNELIDCQKGDRLQVRLIARRRTAIGGFSCTILNDPDNAWINFIPDLSITLGDTWIVSRNLPDITGLDLLKTLAFIYGGSYEMDPLRKQISLTSLTEVVYNTSQAVDWSAKVSELDDLSWTPRLEPYGQKNYLKYKENAELTNKTYGNGLIAVNAKTLPAETTLFELAFGASELSGQTIAGYGNPLKVELRTVTGTGSNLSINKKSTVPRLVLNYAKTPVAVPTKVFDKEGNATKTVVYLQPSWFGGRPNVAVNGQTNFSLAFDSTADNKAERTLIQAYYGGLIRILRRPRVVTISMYLHPVDVANIDLSKPVRIKRVRVGSLDISDNFFIVSKIASYQAGKTTAVTLVCFD